MEKKANDKTVKIERVEWIGTGCVLLNFASSQRGDGGIGRGRILRIVGDNSAGKTATALEIANWFYRNIKKIKTVLFPKVKKIEIHYNNAEGVMDFPIDEMFGEEFEIEVKWKNIRVLEKAGADILNTIKKQKEGTAVLYIVDTWDVLQPYAEIVGFEKAIKKEEKAKMGYGQEKPAYATKYFLPMLCDEMESGHGGYRYKDFTFIVIAQARDNIGSMFGGSKRVSGGGGWNFYKHQEIWLREKQKLEKTVRGEKIPYGVKLEAYFKKNKLAKPFRRSQFSLYFDYGFDDIGSMLDWLYGPKRIKKGISKKLVEKHLKGMPFKKIKSKTLDREILKEFISKKESRYKKLVAAVDRQWKCDAKKTKQKNKRKFF